MSSDNSEGSCNNSVDSWNYFYDVPDHIQKQIDELNALADENYSTPQSTPPQATPPPEATPNPPEGSTPIPNANTSHGHASTSNPVSVNIDKKSKEWIDSQLFIDSGAAKALAKSHPNPMRIKCVVDFGSTARTLAGISKYAKKEFDDFVGMDTIRFEIVRGWIVNIRDSELFGKRILLIDDGTRQVECYLRLDRDVYPLIHKPVEVGRLILLYKICAQFDVTFGKNNIDYDTFTLHGGYSNILAVF